jgi:[protein-PII] uridylyltransferase
MIESAVNRSELDTLHDEQPLVDYVLRERAALEQRWSPEYNGRTWVQEYTSLMDTVVRRLFTLSLERTGGSPSPNTPENATPNTSPPVSGIAVVATGGYGQRMLAPGSDLDITVMVNRDDDRPVLRSFFSLVMDVLMGGARIKVGYAYRPLADAEGNTLDHQTQTALLDARYLIGDGALFARFDRLFHHNLQMAGFLFRKEKEWLARREKHGGTPFATEPDIKNGPGGMRDLQTAAWMAHVRFRRPGEALWRDLVRRKVITREEMRALLEARELLLSSRISLHFAAGERRDLLSRPRQDEVASRLGFENSEAFAKRLYPALNTIYHITDKVVARCLEAPIPLDDSGLTVVRRRVAVPERVKTTQDPLWMFKALDFCQTHDVELAITTEEEIERYLEAQPWTPENQRSAGKAFLNLLVKPGDVGKTLRRMRRTGILEALLPELHACMSLVPYDPTHIHTVGEHSLCVLDNLIHLREAVEDTDTLLGTYRQIYKSLESELPLLLAALLHDIGKQWSLLRSGQRAKHEETGAERVPEIGLRLGCTSSDIENTKFLVRQHLLLAETSRLRDLNRNETIRETARVVGESDRLKMLYLLTYADTSAVGPGVFSEMNARLLEELFLRTDDYLNRATLSEPPPDAGVRDEQLQTVRERLRRRLAQNRVNPAGVSPESIREHIEAMPPSYLLNTPLEMLSLHLAMVNRLREGEPVVVDVRSLAGGILTELTVVTHDDPVPGLLAKITGALLSCDIDIHTAQVFTREMNRGEFLAIDTLRINYRGKSLTIEKRESVEEALRTILRGEKTVEELLARRRRLPTGQTIRDYQVAETSDAEYTLLDVVAPDEQGVLYRLAALFTGFGWNIVSARVSAWGGSVRLAFYLTGSENRNISHATVQEQIERYRETQGEPQRHYPPASPP